MIDTAIASLVAYAERTGLIEPCERNWAVNTLLEALKLDSYTAPETPVSGDIDLAAVLGELMDDAHARGVLPEDSVVYRDLFDTMLMGRLTPRPAQVVEKFKTLYAQSPQKATDWYYQFSQDTNYIRRDRIAKDMKWVTPTEYGDLDITINLSKPEKDPKAIAAARNLPASAYPRCQLCAENEGYAGRVNHPARQNHRIVPITINGSPWFLQYSPYVYYNEHCICLNSEHTPMKIDRACFAKLLDFVGQFPHYFVGSNADLPIVGGSILAHDHFQGGHYTFAMAKAPIEQEFIFPGFADVKAGIVKWPMSVIRISCGNPERLVELADRILTSWRGYTDEAAFIFAETEGVPHNTITPIARMRDSRYELDLVLRNNITTEEHPLGVYHPHAELHHIKKENIGLIEVMGLAVLPARLKEELTAVADALVSGADLRADERTAKHADWAEGFRDSYTITADNALDIVKQETGKVFATVLEHAGVYKRTDEGRAAFLRFLEQV
ncbi:UDP-glucose--hexose-1-phosphate uridylyltransferase [uncultured Pseudoflavonifractor sp.]|uniref:UDP-glucose--hexose-1-phosphate uridylyltransferase n=1 Tax=uncultured Pseudoflavonifractor sp. TaxID=1221379 RepID=UPI0025D3B994|nr:UDP-glucose--hexose-1-phosphate uridylyltransferase [uncultured Pseudoflavonifractor sp.]